MNNVNIFCAEGYIINFLEMDNTYQRALGYFLKNRLPEKDIVIFPITFKSHCTLIMMFRKQKILVSIFGQSRGTTNKTRQDCTATIQYNAYYRMKQCSNSSICDWKIYNPTDIPKQQNLYDCGIFCCLFADVLIKQNTECFF